jgi:glutamine synthetase
VAYTEKEVLRFVEENDVKFIRLAFCDIDGQLKNISITPRELEGAFKNGISFDGRAVKGMATAENTDLLLFPDPSTLKVLPWRPQHGRVIRFYCDIRYVDGRPFEGDTRHILAGVVERAKKMGYTFNIGTECEFYLFKLDDNAHPTYEPLDNAGYFDVSPLDKGENIRREICLTLEEMGIFPESSHHEKGPGQNEIVFKYADALTAADNFITFKTAVKTVSALSGMHASFMPKPLKDYSGNGMHINISMMKNGVNIFDVHDHKSEAASFTAGVLNHIREMTVFLNPIANSYVRFGAFDAPKFVTWSPQNRSQLLRVTENRGDRSRMEIRSADTSLSPYLSLALMISAGLDGIEKKSELAPAVNIDRHQQAASERAEALPMSLGEAIECAQSSEFIESVLPRRVLEMYLDFKKQEWEEYSAAADKSVLDKRLFLLL